MPSIRTIALAGFAWALLAPRMALAQTDTAPAQIDNHANGRDYQPTLDETRRREQSAGILPDAADQARTDHTVDAIGRALLGGNAGAAPAPR